EANLLLTGRLRLFGTLHDVRRAQDEGDALRLDWNFHPAETPFEPFRKDPKFPWEVARLAALPRLGLAYFISGRGRYARAAASIVEDWSVTQPVGQGLHFASALEVGIRLIAMMQAFHFFRRSEAFQAQTLATLVRRIAREAAWLQGHRSVERLVAGNHLVGELAGLVVTDLTFPELGQGNRLEDNLARFARAIDEQVAPDGTSLEQSATYGRFVADFVAAVLATAAAAGHPVPAGLVDRAAALAGWLGALTTPDGQLPLMGDNDGGRGVDWAETVPSSDARGVIMALAALTGRPEPLLALGRPGAPVATHGYGPDGAELTWWYAGPDGLARLTALRQNMPPPRALRHFPDGGWAVATGSAPDHLVVRCGPFGHGLPKPSGHSHADWMAPVLTLDGTPLLVDPGNFGYTTVGEARQAFRSEEAHAVLSFEGAPMAVPGTTFRWDDIPAPARLVAAQPDSDSIELAGSWRTTGGSRSVAARRVIVYNCSRSRVDIRDDWSAGGDPPAAVVQRWPLAAGSEVTAGAGGTGFEVRTDGGAVFLFSIEPAASIEVERRPLAPQYAAQRPAIRV
ncbi:MAG TPA: alginate lyase family protein, partial [Candidatus Eisenbacteria bacterium]